MKTKKLLKILCVVFAVLFALTVVGGIVYGAIKDGTPRGNSNNAVVGYADDTPFTGNKSNSNERSKFSEAVPFAAANSEISYLCAFKVFVYDSNNNVVTDCYPINIVTYHNKLVKTTTLNSSGGYLRFFTNYTNGKVTLEGSTFLAYAYCVADGRILYFRKVGDGRSNPFLVTPAINGTHPTLELSFNPEDCYNVIYDAGHTAGYDEGLSAGYDEGYNVGFEEGQSAGYDEVYNQGYDEGHTAGYDEGHTAGYDAGHTAGYDEGYGIAEEDHAEDYDDGYYMGYTDGKKEGHEAGYTEGQKAGHEAGYKEGHTDGLNLGESKLLTNPVSSFIQPAHEFMNTKFFGDLTYATVFNVVLFVAVAIIFIKMFSGG